MLKVKDYNLRVEPLLEALLLALQATLYPETVTNRPSINTLSLRGGKPKGNVSPLPLLAKLGRQTVISAGDISFRVMVPSAAELLSEVASKIQQGPAPAILGFYRQLKLDAQAHDEAIERAFGDLPTAEQDSMLGIIRPVYAMCYLYLRLSTLDRATTPDLSPARDSATALQAMKRERETLRQWARVIRARYWWTDIRSECIREFLPPGQREGEDQLSGPAAGVPRLSLGSERVTREAFADEARYDFYVTTLGAVGVVRPTGEFAKRQYVAFLFELPSGIRVAVLDANNKPSEHDAIYIFLVTKNERGETARWVHDAQLSKTDLCQRRRGEGAFWGRHYHSKHWRDNVAETLREIGSIGKES